jgi:single-strand DNA-binding protein
MGRLTRDPELRRTSSGLAVTSFCVAVERDVANRNGEKETDFINCVAWRQTGEFVNKWFTKGQMIVVSGRLQINKWTDKNGVKRYDPEIVANNVYFGESRKDKERNNVGVENTSYTGEFSNYAYPIPGWDDDEAVLPF